MMSFLGSSLISHLPQTGLWRDLQPQSTIDKEKTQKQSRKSSSLWLKDWERDVCLPLYLHNKEVVQPTCRRARNPRPTQSALYTQGTGQVAQSGDSSISNEALCLPDLHPVMQEHSGLVASAPSYTQKVAQ